MTCEAGVDAVSGNKNCSSHNWEIGLWSPSFRASQRSLTNLITCNLYHHLAVHHHLLPSSRVGTSNHLVDCLESRRTRANSPQILGMLEPRIILNRSDFKQLCLGELEERGLPSMQRYCISILKATRFRSTA